MSRPGNEAHETGARAPRAAPTVHRFLDETGRLKVWPSRLKDQRLAMAWLAGHFDWDRAYTEKQVNARLQELHAFGDWALLRRALVDYRWLERDSDGSRYARRRPAPGGGTVRAGAA
jgi:hypothetical protein